MKTVLLAALLLLVAKGHSQAVLTEETVILDTYGFHGADPSPLLMDNPKIHPYFRYRGYSLTPTKKAWKVIKLENEHIAVYLLPEIGGKVWGAVEKESGNEFIYRNEVVKFRNIAMRGPWTSGGIEFNFGVMGHHPGTATPVDYRTRTNPDGSVSCIVGNMDLPSRTYWQVEIRLEGDKAYFETHARWYNPTPLSQSYYNWMTAAAVASQDLEFFIPGSGYLEHDGSWKEWHIDERGRNLSMYRNNNFGGSKSYHIVGDYQNHFGGYYHEREFGYGHLADPGEMPGQKLWLWALSRAGGIWEDLLTDSDGQYIEFQTGRLFNQFSPGAVNPISQVAFEPHLLDSWSEKWFPIKKIGGLEAASKYGALNVERHGDSAYLGINALQGFEEELHILVNGREVAVPTLSMRPMEVWETTLACGDDDLLEIRLGEGLLNYSSRNKTLLKRNFERNSGTKRSEVAQLAHEATEALNFREYALADEKVSALLDRDSFHVPGLLLRAQLEFRKTRYDQALEHANRALELDIYDFHANYLAGISHWAQKDALNALESLGWAARSMEYRSAAYAQMAEIHLHLDHTERAEDYANKALDFNRHNLNARQLLLVVHRKSGDQKAFDRQMEALGELSPINHFASFEQLLFRDGDPKAWLKGIQNEFPNETLLELALGYLNLGEEEAAQNLLSLASDPKSGIHRAYLSRNSDPEGSSRALEALSGESPDYVLPYRRESIPVLEWAVAQNPNWKFKYYLAQNYMAVGLEERAKPLLIACGDLPDNDTFRRFRAEVLEDAPYESRLKDLQKAMELNGGYWKNWDETIRFYLEHGKNREAAELGKRAMKKFPGNYTLGLNQSKALLATGDHSGAIELLGSLKVLPFEHAWEGKSIYTRAHQYLAWEHMARGDHKKAIPLLEASKLWPEHLGVGAPYDPDNRLADYLLARCWMQEKDPERAKAHLEAVADHSLEGTRSGPQALVTALALKELEREEALAKLLGSLEAKAPRDSMAALVLALYHGEKDKAETLAAKTDIEPKLYQILSRP